VGGGLVKAGTRAPPHPGLAVPAAAAAVRKRRALQRIAWRRGIWARPLRDDEEDEDGADPKVAGLEFSMGLRRVVAVMEGLGRLDRFGWWGRRWRQQL